MNICVTGASQGLGRSLCRELASRGDNVWGIARGEEKLRTLAADLPPQRFRWSRGDVATEASLQEWLHAMNVASFVPDCIILNASIQQNDMEGAYDHAAGQEVLRINLEGALRCVEAFLPLFLARRRGSFVTIASTAALRPSVRSASYAASKAGLAMAFRSLRLRYREDGVRFATVFLGPIATEMWEGRRHWLVSDPGDAAATVASFARGSRHTLYYPFLSTFLLRATSCLPDRVFALCSNALLKNALW